MPIRPRPRLTGRALSKAYTNAGVDRGFGFRDSMQDVLGILHADAPAAQRIKHCFRSRKTMAAQRVLSCHRGSGRRRNSDDHLWSVFSVCSYIRETGDVGFWRRGSPMPTAVTERYWSIWREGSPLLWCILAGTAFRICWHRTGTTALRR